MNNKRNKIIKISVFIICIIVIITSVTLMFLRELNNKEKEPEKKTDPKIEEKNSFTTNIIKEINKDNKENYLLSPYNIEIALNMLRDGANGNTKTEIDKVIGNREITDVKVPGVVNVANAVFIKNIYQSKIKTDFANAMKTKYKSELIYDEFKTPNVINDWANKETNGMIPKLLDQINDNYILGLASALAIDVKWQNQFDCMNTSKEEFTKLDNTTMDAEMMHQTYKYNAQYIKTDDAEGIIIPYRKESGSNVELEFVGLIPNNNVNDYVNSLTMEKIDKIFTSTKSASDKYRIRLSLPRFTYSYSIDELNVPLSNLGIKDVFNSDKADLSKIIDEKAYVSQAVHKTFIELSETGTKAAAITYFGVDAAGMPVEEEYELINVKFDKPFVYMIREKNSGEILFFGTVYEPSKWVKSTCSK